MNRIVKTGVLAFIFASTSAFANADHWYGGWSDLSDPWLTGCCDGRNDNCDPWQKCDEGKQKDGKQKDGRPDDGKQKDNQDKDGKQKGGKQHGDHHGDHHKSCPNGLCDHQTKETCFNLVCFYRNEEAPEGFKNCRVAAKFNKAITSNGGEVADDSTRANPVDFELACDNSPIFNGPAYRFTGLLGTRIQGETGPMPAVLLPRGSLHGNYPKDAGYHLAQSILQLDVYGRELKSRGKCHIWTGTP